MTLLVCFGLLVTFLANNGFAQEEKSTMTPNEMLEYSLADLQAKMQMVIDSNKKQRAKNEALRKRILQLKEETRRIGDKKINLLESSVDLTDQLRGETQDAKVLVGRFKILQERISQLEKEDRLHDNQTSAVSQKQLDLEATVGDLEREINEYQKRLVSTTGKVLKDEYDEEKYRYRQLIQDNQARLKRTQTQHAQLKKQTDISALKREDFLGAQQLLKQKHAKIDEELADLERTEQGYLDEYNIYKGVKTGVIKSANQELAQLKAYSAELDMSLNRLKDIIKAIQSSAGKERQKLTQSISHLKAQQRLLAQKEQVLQKTVEHYVDLKEKLQERNILTASAQDWYGRLKDLDMQEKSLEMKMGGMDQKRRDIPAQKRSEIKKISDLEKKIRVLKKENERKRTQVTRSWDRQRKQMVGEKNYKSRKTQKQYDSLSNQVNRLKSTMDQLLQDQIQLRVKMGRIDMDLQDLQGEREVLHDELFVTENSPSPQVQFIREEVEALKIRSSVLADSLEAVESRYDTEELAVSNYARETRELNQYLDLLKLENGALHDKVASYMGAVEKLESRLADRKGSPSGSPKGSPKGSPLDGSPKGSPQTIEK